jgi:hypothetical protein
MRRALHSAHIQEYSPNHWVCYVDGALVKDSELDMIPPYTALSSLLERQRSETISNQTSSSGVTISSADDTVLPQATSTQTLPLSDSSSHSSNELPSSSSHRNDGNDVDLAVTETISTVIPSEGKEILHYHNTAIIPTSENGENMILSFDHESVHIRKEEKEKESQESQEENESSDARVSGTTEEIIEKEECEVRMTTNDSNIEDVEETNDDTKEHKDTEPCYKSTVETDRIVEDVPPISAEDSSCSSSASFISVPSFSFLNGTYYLYQKVSTSFNAGTSSHFFHALQDTLAPSQGADEEDETEETLAVGSKRAIDNDDDDEEEKHNEKKAKVAVNED